jgi:hypothetical protein
VWATDLAESVWVFAVVGFINGNLMALLLQSLSARLESLHSAI